jgi:hypothetical protein
VGIGSDGGVSAGLEDLERNLGSAVGVAIVRSHMYYRLTEENTLG